MTVACDESWPLGNRRAIRGSANGFRMWLSGRRRVRHGPIGLLAGGHFWGTPGSNPGKHAFAKTLARSHRPVVVGCIVKDIFCVLLVDFVESNAMKNSFVESSFFA